MSKKSDGAETAKAAREAKRNGQSPSAAGVTTGASKQINHKSGSERSKENTPRGGKS